MLFKQILLYEDVFVLCLFSYTDNDIDKNVLLIMKESELEEIGVKSFGVRRKLKMKIDELQVQKETSATGPTNSVADKGPTELEAEQASDKPVAKHTR